MLKIKEKNKKENILRKCIFPFLIKMYYIFPFLIFSKKKKTSVNVSFSYSYYKKKEILLFF